MTPAAFGRALGNWSAGAGPIYARLSRAIRTAVERGELGPGLRLPSERTLAGQLALSRTTVVSAYEQLRRDRWIESRRGSGTRVRAAARPEVLRLREDSAGSFR